MQRAGLIAGLFGGILLCGSCSAEDPCKVGFIGDPQQAPEASLLYTDGASGTWSEVSANASLPLVPPPQGGLVLFAGVRVRNLDGCGIALDGILRDPDSGKVLAIDKKGTAVSDLVVGPDGWGRPDGSEIFNFSNIAVCPNFNMESVTGRSVVLEIQVTDRGGRTVTASAPVMPTCMLQDPEMQSFCTCACMPGFKLGTCAMQPKP